MCSASCSELLLLVIVAAENAEAEKSGSFGADKWPGKFGLLPESTIAEAAADRKTLAKYQRAGHKLINLKTKSLSQFMKWAVQLPHKEY
jgi:hypothetical protein